MNMINSIKRLCPIVGYLAFNHTLDSDCHVQRTAGITERTFQLNGRKKPSESNCNGAEAERKETEPKFNGADAEQKPSESNCKGAEAERKETEPNLKGAEVEQKETEPNCKGAEAERKETEPNCKPAEAEQKETEPNSKGSEAEQKEADQVRDKTNQNETNYAKAVASELGKLSLSDANKNSTDLPTLLREIFKTRIRELGQVYGVTNTSETQLIDISPIGCSDCTPTELFGRNRFVVLILCRMLSEREEAFNLLSLKFSKDTFGKGNLSEAFLLDAHDYLKKEVKATIHLMLYHIQQFYMSLYLPHLCCEEDICSSSRHVRLKLYGLISDRGKTLLDYADHVLSKENNRDLICKTLCAFVYGQAAIIRSHHDLLQKLEWPDAEAEKISKSLLPAIYEFYRDSLTNAEGNLLELRSMYIALLPSLSPWESCAMWTRTDVEGTFHQRIVRRKDYIGKFFEESKTINNLSYAFVETFFNCMSSFTLIVGQRYDGWIVSPSERSAGVLADLDHKLTLKGRREHWLGIIGLDSEIRRYGFRKKLEQKDIVFSKKLSTNLRKTIEKFYDHVVDFENIYVKCSPPNSAEGSDDRHNHSMQIAVSKLFLALYNDSVAAFSGDIEKEIDSRVILVEV